MRVVEKALGLKKENGLEKRSREKRERDGEVETKDNRPAGQGGEAGKYTRYSGTNRLTIQLEDIPAYNNR